MSWKLLFIIFLPPFLFYSSYSFLQQLLPILSSDPIPYNDIFSISELEDGED
jgi:hypothetical protein